MSCTIEKILNDAKLLVNRLKDHDNAADSLIIQTQTLNKRVDAMKQYEEDLNELNEIARHKPRAQLVLGIAQENRQIRELQQDNKELRMSLEEHQSALELIMSKYREQILKLLTANKMDMTIANGGATEEIREKIDKICEMAAVMQKAAAIDDKVFGEDREQIIRLQIENKGLRELLEISATMGRSLEKPETHEEEVQTDLDNTDDLNNTVIHVESSSS